MGMHRTIIVGSPRPDGRCATLANELFEACIEECPDDGVSILAVSSVEVLPCLGCNACKAVLEKDDPRYRVVPEKSDPLSQNTLVFKSDASAHQCVIEDEMSEVRKHLDAADEVIVVSPVFFSGPPSQLKALLDRLQPYFFSDIRSRTKERRPLTLHVVREDGNPFGFEALKSVVASALGVAGFKLERVLDWVGCFDEEGQICSEPAEVEIK